MRKLQKEVNELKERQIELNQSILVRFQLVNDQNQAILNRFTSLDDRIKRLETLRPTGSQVSLQKIPL